ncbi:conserved hypothetical protein [Treponema pallidum subsp. pallidum str. Chicago]|nr:conserved hypothetical protein [Treponema pallidum subsp. pallidum str. Chicago]
MRVQRRVLKNFMRVVGVDKGYRLWVEWLSCVCCGYVVRAE